MLSALLPAGLFGLLSLIDPTAAQQDDLGSVLQSKSNLSTYYNLIKKYPEVILKLPSYDGVTIVAPSNAAFENIPGTQLNGIWNESDPSIAVPILEYHILQGTVSTGALESGPSVLRSSLLQNPTWTNVTGGQNVMVNKQPGDVIVFTSSEGIRTTQVEGDIKFAGGLVQVVDNLLIPPVRLENTTESFKLPAFLGALYTAKLLPSLSERKNVTIFAPRNEAFQRVAGSLKELDKDAVKNFLNYHVVEGQILASSDLKNGTSLSTLASQNLNVIRSGNNLFLNSAQVVQPDILLANGIMHIVDNVLNPDMAAATPNPTAVSQAPVFPESSASGVPFTSAIPCTVSCPVTTTATPTAAASTRASTTGIRTTTSPGAAARTGVAAGAALLAGLAAFA
ncbi:fasciclin domain-containing protein [Colletotrichum tofieldiae]|uniref:Fasciclin domain-containing protein n=1 Tax=Colletotrichum tofieldiae TaxID=708197 RepID=A0A166YUU7_9PEZI|nr:fasciclin domain-containing protein [Colletotrichum tofieldiae]GKT62869.1 fasciclin domain-containing protein [Colletotrichum tofieldiae]GKT69090.1 fasciclin domain-containing protein [Colletotrichum tofieldiae]GKT96620.1 fasciclin domain-containing protein [Colletotrichum tofieldiae]